MEHFAQEPAKDGARAESPDRGFGHDRVNPDTAKRRAESRMREEESDRNAEAPDKKLNAAVRKVEVQGWLKAEKIPNGLQISVEVIEDGMEVVTLKTDYGVGGKAIIRHSSRTTTQPDGTSTDPQAEILDQARAMARKSGLLDPARDADHPKLKELRQWLDEAGIPRALQMEPLDGTPITPERIAFKTPASITQISVEGKTRTQWVEIAKGIAIKCGMLVE